MKSSLASGSKSFLSPRYKQQIEAIIDRQAKKFGIKVYSFANGGNHLHAIVKLQNHQLFKNFLRAVTGLIAKLILGSSKLKDRKFFDARPFTRIASWGRGYEYLKSYVTLNKLEALGFFAPQPRGHRRRKLMSVTIDALAIETS